MEKTRKGSLDSKLKNRIQTTVSGTEHTVTTNKNKIIHRKLISNTLPFQQPVTAQTKRINTRQTYHDQSTCSKTLDFIQPLSAETSASTQEQKRHSQETTKGARIG